MEDARLVFCAYYESGRETPCVDCLLASLEAVLIAFFILKLKNEDQINVSVCLYSY